VVLLAAVVLPAVATIVYHFPPEEYGFYPGCVFHAVTGWHCPGCGATRCCSALLHGDVAQAFAYNPLFMVASPLLLASLLQMAYGQWTGRRGPLPRLPPWSIYLIFWVIVAYWVLRNIDVYPLTLLAPHTLPAATLS
jgi:hypothetical protein